MIAGIQLSSIKSLMQNVRDAQASLTRLASSGFRYVQLQWHAKTIPAPVLRDSLAENGMKAVSVQDYTREVLADPEYYVDLAGTCGFTDVCVSGLPDDVVTVNDLRSFANGLCTFSDELIRSGLVLSFHPRWMDYRPIDGAPATLRLLDEVPQMRVVLDYHHVFRAGLDPIQLTAKLKGRIDFIHCKDTAADGKTLDPVGSGTVVWKPLVDVAEEAGARIAFVEQEAWQGDPFVCMESSLRYLLSLGMTAE